jgi:hypothetical protein
MVATVLVGTDGTPRAQIAVERATALAASVQASLIVLSVTQPPVITTRLGPLGINAIVASVRRRREDAEAAACAGAQTEACGVHATPLVCTGDPAREIIAVADEVRRHDRRRRPRPQPRRSLRPRQRPSRHRPARQTARRPSSRVPLPRTRDLGEVTPSG